MTDTDTGCVVALIVLALMVCLARGPRETGWLGWSGGWTIRKDSSGAERESDVEMPAEKGPVETSSADGDGTKPEER